MFCKVFHVFLCMVAPQNVLFEGGGVRTLFRTKGAIRIFVVLGQCSLWLHYDDKICSGFALAASCPLNCDYFFFPLPDSRPVFELEFPKAFLQCTRYHSAFCGGPGSFNTDY